MTTAATTPAMLPCRLMDEIDYDSLEFDPCGRPGGKTCAGNRRLRERMRRLKSGTEN